MSSKGPGPHRHRFTKRWIKTPEGWAREERTCSVCSTRQQKIAGRWKEVHD